MLRITIRYQTSAVSLLCSACMRYRSGLTHRRETELRSISYLDVSELSEN